MNPMKEIKVGKLTLNIGVGSDGKMDRTISLLKRISKGNPKKTTSQKRIPTWGVRPNLPIACMVTVRGKKAEELLVSLFEGIDKKISKRKFDKQGNFSFGIPEYINIPGMEYDVELGIIGLEVAVTLERPGFRVSRKSLFKGKVGKTHRILPEEAIEFIKTKYKVEIA
jgi:large subunit ribosomal protein L5